MNILKSIVWIIIIAVVVWVGYILISKKSAVPAAQQGAPVVETAGQQVPAPAPAPSGALPAAPAPAVTPAPAPMPKVMPPPAPAPAPKANY